MLRSLDIQNFALIDHLVFEPTKGFNVVTGETGAGKTIIFDALGLVLGKRAESNHILDSARKCVIEAEFQIQNAAVKNFFKLYDFDEDEFIILRREITSTGKSRSFINDTPASLLQVRTLAASIISIHNQNETLEIFKSANQLEILDQWAGAKDLREKYTNGFKQLVQLRLQLVQLMNTKESKDKEHDYRQFLLKELDEFEPVVSDEGLEEEIDVLSNAEIIKQLGFELNNYFSLAEQSIVNQLSEHDKSILKLDTFLPNKQLYQRYKQIIIELEDLAKEIDRETSGLDLDEEQLRSVEARFSLLQDLFKKHQSKSIHELMQTHSFLADQQLTGVQLVEDIEKMRGLIVEKEGMLHRLATQLSGLRKKAIPSLEKRIQENLSELEMPNASFTIELRPSIDLVETGMDTISILFSANKNRAAQALSKVASGGETSRLALVLKSIVNQKSGTLIFDEIDTGVSGKVAKKVGELFNEMGQTQQVISITHSPQVASSADSHFYVYKQEEHNQTLTRLKVLDKHSQIEAIAEMLSGSNISATAIANAKTLLNQD